MESNSTIQILKRQLHLSEKQIQAVLNLLSEGATIPFIARYRKEATGNLDEETIRLIETQYAYQENLKERKEAVIRLIEEKGLMNPSLKERILTCEKLADLEDLYRPYREKKKTKASAALEAGLQPAADRIMKEPVNGSFEELLAPFVKKSGLPFDEVRQGAAWIIAQELSDDAGIRKMVYQEMMKGKIETKLKKDAEDEKNVYSIYYDFSSPIRQLKPHQILAINRAEKEKVISVSFDFDSERVMQALEKKLIRRPNTFVKEHLKDCIKDACKRLIIPSLQRQIRRELTETADEAAIQTFSDNLEHLLLTRPLGPRKVLGFDPAYRTGCKLAVLNERGDMETVAVIFPSYCHGNDEKAAKELSRLIDAYGIEYIAIGNGTASRESESFVAGVLKKYPKVQYALVSEAGASVYSASDLAREEFPDLTVEKRSAISIGRRIQDPLSELVKIDPKAIGVGEYQHDLPARQLSEALDFTTMKVVNQVGVNINTASASILKYISGLNKTSIRKLLDERKKHPFRSRREIADLKGISDKTFEQCAGFLRVPESRDPLDHTGIHPESYDTARRLLKELNLSLEQQNTPEFERKLKKQDAGKLAGKLGSDHFLVEDIIKELLHPGLDPRDTLDGPLLRSDVLELKDLKEGMELQGTIRNVTSFGAFVDIGLHEDGLIHISKMARRFIKDPKEVVHTGQVVTCYVAGIDQARNRVQLSLIKNL